MTPASTIDITGADAQPLRAYLTQPAQGSGPGLVLVHEAPGLNDFIREMAERLAEEGYVCLVPDLSGRLDAGVNLDASAVDVARREVVRERFDVDQAVLEIAATAAALRALPSHCGKLGVIGWGVAGRLAILAAARHQIDCVVSYDGVASEHYSDEFARLACPALLQLGDGDLSAATREALTAASAGQGPIEIQVYPACSHGFADRSHKNYDKPSARLAYSRTIALLRRVLGPRYDLSRLWDAHTFHEFANRDVDATMATMVAQPYVNHIPTMTGGVGHDHLQRFYKNHFVNSNPPDTRLIPVSRTVGADRLVDEMVFCFTHTCEIPWMLPGIAPTGRYVEVPLVAIVNFRGEKLYHEHIYWDQASVLVQIGVLDPSGLPVAGIATAKKLIDETLPSNEMMGEAWARSADLAL